MCLSTQPHLSRQAERELGTVLTADDHLVPSLGPPLSEDSASAVSTSLPF